jgi:hypothetical protein
MTVSMWANWQGSVSGGEDLWLSASQSQDLGAADGLNAEIGWQHVCTVFDGTTARVYVDGALAASGSWSLPANTTAVFKIGAGADSTGVFNGALDEYRVYDYALTGAQVATLYGELTGQLPRGALREWWLGIGGSYVSDLTSNPRYPWQPDGWEYVSRLEGPTSCGDNYGSRLRGYLYPPASGNYTFWIASDDRSELRLSSDALPENAMLIAQVPGWTYEHQWDKYAAQQSAAVFLEAGHKYYAEVLQKEGTGGDNVAIAWQGPGFSREVAAGTELWMWSDFTRGDVLADGGVDLHDYAALAGSWLRTDCSQPVRLDLDGDCTVGLQDLVLMLDNWLKP